MQLVQSILTKNPCYTSGRKITVKGLMLHSVGCPQPKASVFIRNWNLASFDRACVHAFIDADDGVVYQCLPWNHRGWHGGGSSNNTHIGVEMCEPSTIKYTGGSTWVEKSDGVNTKACVMRTYKSAVELFAYLCQQYNLDPLKDGVIVSHKEGCARGIASNHGDPEHIWNKFGLTMNGFRQDVAKAMKGDKFKDDDSHYAEKHINKLVDYKIVEGYADGSFRPTEAITRAEFATMITNALENACKYNLKSVTKFSDVAGHWASSDIYKLVACGIVHGYPDGTFKPDEHITRAQAAILGAYMLSYCGHPVFDTDTAFNDTDDHYAEEHIETLKSRGIVNGVGNGAFNPDGIITRADAAIIVANCLTYLGL